MAEVTNEEPTAETNNNDNVESNENNIITVGRLVEVASRTWPGINKPGGVARVVQVHFDNDQETNDKATGQPTHVNVRYMVGSSREKMVPIEYVKLAPQYETTSIKQTSTSSSLRDRSMLLGRCRRCGSLRTDCGSCDWAMEENTLQSATISPKLPTRKTRKSKRNTTISESLLLDGNDSDSSNSSSNEEYDIAKLRKLIRNSKERRKQSENKKNSSATLELKRYSKSSETWRRRYPVLIDDLSSSDSSDSETEKERSSLRKKPRRLVGGTSILESLPANDGGNDTNKTTKKSKSKVTSKSSRAQEKLQTLSKSMEFSSDSDSDIDDIPLTSVVLGGKHSLKRSYSKRAGSGEALADIPLNTSNQSIKENSYDQQLLELEARARFQVRQQQEVIGANDEDADFIQPEGKEAVENLPDDMVDLSRNVPYAKLGPLFDSMASKLEDEILPDFRLRMAGLQYRLRTLQQQLETGNTSVQQLLGEYHVLWEEVRSSVIQNGTDQCRATLRRLMDDRLYKKHRKKLTPQERKRCRGAGIMDARNLRMDAMDEAVEAFVRKLKQAVVACEIHCEPSQSVDINSEEGSNTSMGFEDDVSSEDEDLLPITAMVDNETPETELVPFHPHQHATRVRKDPSNKKSISSNNYHHPSRKRPRTSKLASKDGENRSKMRNPNRQKTRIGTTGIGKEEKNQNKNEPAESMSEMNDLPPSDPVEKFFDVEAGVASNDSNDVPIRKARKRRVSSRNAPQHSFAKPHDSKQSISERMQAFLDANEANGVQIFDDEDEGEAEGVRINKVSRSHLTYPIFEPRRRGIQNVESKVDETVAINDRGEVMIEEKKDDSHFASYDTQSLFDQLSSTDRHVGESTAIYDDEDLPDVDRSWKGLLAEMEVAISNKAQSMNKLLERALRVLIGRGSRTLLDLISSKDLELSLHIRTLSICVRSLKFLSTEEIPIPFSEEKQGCFLDFVVLQLVDALYALSLPSAWALGIENCGLIFQKLTPLRNALALQIPLVEAVSRCIVRSLECQQWRKSKSKDHVFVSSLDPSLWNNFLQTGTKFEDPQVTRFQKLGRVWPRIEVDALWRIIAFASATPSISTDKSIFRLQIVSKLFSSGVLAVETVGKEETLPPSKNQLLACQQEIRYFSSLLRKRALDSLPKTDSMLVKLIQHSLKLQRDSWEGDDNARASCFPDSSDDSLAKKASSMFWRITSPSSLQSHKENCLCMHITEFTFAQCHDHDDKKYKMLLYPTSNVLRSCITLLINWIHRVSTKKIRQNRLTNSLKALQNELLKDESNVLQNSVKKGEVTFENAFSTKPPIEVGTGSERASIFNIEAASYFQIFTSICMKNQIDPDLPQSVWKNISDDKMKKKQCDVVELGKNFDKYTGDAYRLFAAAKIMATLLLLQMNISPWHLSLGASVTRLFKENLQMKTESFSFPLSCIFACLNCLCDLEIKPHVFSQFYEIIILIFRNLSAMVARGETSIASDHLRFNFILNLNFVLMKCIRMHLSSGGSHESFHLRLCLSSIRAIQSFVGMCSHATIIRGVNDTQDVEDQPQNESDDNDDMWGDLDDSDLAALDLSGSSEGQKEAQQQQEELWELLSDALEQSKPSKRFAILRNAGGILCDSAFHLSSFGKLLVAGEVNKICDCLCAALAAMQPESTGFFQLKKVVSKWSQPSYENDEDSQFLCQIERKLTSELCSLAETYPTCRTFVSENVNNMFFNFLKALLDSSRLEKLPSCNLERIRESSGRLGTEQAMIMLDLFNDDSFQDINDEQQGSALRRLQSRRRKSVTEIWEFCSKLGTAFSKNDAVDTTSATLVGISLLNIDSDLLRKFDISDDVISLENETFKTFRLLRNIVSASTTNHTNFVVFESIASCLLMLLADHILGIVQSLKYNDQTSSDKEYKKAELTELLASFVELFVSSAAWILQEGAKNRSKAWSFLQTYLRDRLFSPILRNQPIDTTVALQEIIVAARFVHARPSESVSLPAIHCVGLVGCSKYIGDCFFSSILRRSKQLIEATAFNPQNLGLQNAILEAVLGCGGDLEEAGPWLVGSAFPLGKRRSIRSRIMWPYSSPIQKQIDEYLKFVDENLGSANREDNDDWCNSMTDTKKSFLKNHLVPRLQSVSVSMEKKRRIIMLLSHILENDAPMESASSNPRLGIMDIHIVREILRGLRSNLHKCFMQISVNDELVRAILSCSIHLANSCLLLDGVEQNLMRWGRSKIDSIKGKTMLDLTNSEVLGSYVWLFFRWLQMLGQMIINGDDDLFAMRKHWKNTQCCRLGGMDEERLDLLQITNFETLDRLLIDFEDLAMPSKTKSSKTIVMKNIYAKPTSQELSNDESLEAWAPSISVKKNLKEVMAAILTTS